MRSLHRANSAVALLLFLEVARAAAPVRPPMGHGPEPAGAAAVPLEVGEFRPIEGPASGPGMYYEVVEEEGVRLLRGAYRPGLATVELAVDVPGALRQGVRQVRWRWRVRAFPEGGDECVPGKGDSAASVYLAFKRGLKWYILKYVWSTVGPLGATCDRQRSLVSARDTVVLESGGRPGTWLTELVDVRRSFREHFAGGDASAGVPDLVGVGVMSDGDQTRSMAGADWADFQLLP